MGTVLELSNLELPTRTQGRTGTVLARIKPAAAVPERVRGSPPRSDPPAPLGATTPAG